MRHGAYDRLARAAGCAHGPEPYPPGTARGDGRRPAGRPAPGATAALPPVPPLATDRTGEPVCGRCGTWQSCCFCTAEVHGMREALRRIAEIHSACRPDCPERRRLAPVPRGQRPPR